ncbi:MAG: Atxe2 family lasso peptide isopeptidase [Sphingomonas sp.]|nr:Atxe2 family lasso peptide isopeptidase [Sphingomonas sp.]
MTTHDLVRLRDIGPSVGTGLPASPFALSPDKRQIAFVLSRADPKANDYCQALVVMDLTPDASPRLLDMGGNLIANKSWWRGTRFNSGSAIINTPQWSPDGKQIAYLRLENDLVQARLVRPDGPSVRTVTASRTDVRKLGFSDQGRLIFANEPGIEAAEAARRDEALRGYLYDEAFVPNASSRPSIAGPVPEAVHSLGLETNKERPATAEEAAILNRTRDITWSQDALLVAQSKSGWKAWTARLDPGAYAGQADLFVQAPHESAVRCLEAACMTGPRGIEGLWWSEAENSLIFLRRGGWADSQMLLYRWRPGRAAQQILATNDLLVGCQFVREHLLCAREASARPRRIVLIDARTGSQTELFDPNPEYRGLRLGRTERLHWKTPDGVECFGDLVLPPDYDGARPLPTITVQYLTRGFLRGGVGDEYPIFPLAAQGFAVFSFQRPPDFYETIKDGSLTSFTDAQRADTQNWNDRTRVNSALMGGLDLLVARGIADPARLGITGLSDGATTTQFALVNGPHRFAAAAVSTGFMEPGSTQIYGGIAWGEQLATFGYPSLDQDQTAFWKPISVALNAQSIETPILMQVADEEYLTALESFAHLRAWDRAVEMYVFPAEHHIKQKPSHRLAIYERVIDWFGFWLLGKTDTTTAKAPQYVRWNKLKVGQPDPRETRMDIAPTQASTSTSDKSR